MDLTNDRLWTGIQYARRGFAPTVATYGVVGSEGADSALARIVTIDIDGNVKLEVLRGSAASRQDHLTRA